MGVGEISVVLPEEPTFGISCSVPDDARSSESGVVTCPHPPALAFTAMTCSVVLADPGGTSPGQGFCRRFGASSPPVAGSFATPCTVPAETELATCTGLTPSQRLRLPPGPQAPVPPPSPGSPPASDPGPLTCGPPDADGAMTCTAAPAASTTTTSAFVTYRCVTEADARQLTCVPIAR